MSALFRSCNFCCWFGDGNAQEQGCSSEERVWNWFEVYFRGLPLRFLSVLALQIREPFFEFGLFCQWSPLFLSTVCELFSSPKLPLFTKKGNKTKQMNQVFFLKNDSPFKETKRRPFGGSSFFQESSWGNAERKIHSFFSILSPPLWKIVLAFIFSWLSLCFSFSRLAY